MAKFNALKLSKEERDSLISRFCQALASIKSSIEAAEFVQDLISTQEAEMLAKRLKIAEMLIDGSKYSEIQQALKVCPTTIARVGEWLRYSSGGYRLIISRIKEDEDFKNLPEQKTPLRELKRKYPMYYWPQIVLEEVIKTAKKEQKEKLRRIISKMDKKSALYRQINAAFKTGIKN